MLHSNGRRNYLRRGRLPGGADCGELAGRLRLDGAGEAPGLGLAAISKRSGGGEEKSEDGDALAAAAAGGRSAALPLAREARREACSFFSAVLASKAAWSSLRFFVVARMASALCSATPSACQAAKHRRVGLRFNAS